MGDALRHLGGILVAGIMAAGCSSAPLAQGLDDALVRWGSRSLALDAPSLHAARLVQDHPYDDGLNWYAYRNDKHVAAVVGYMGSNTESSSTLTIDRQRIHGGRVFDHFSQTTYRIRNKLWPK